MLGVLVCSDRRDPPAPHPRQLMLPWMRSLTSKPLLPKLLAELAEGKDLIQHRVPERLSPVLF